MILLNYLVLSKLYIKIITLVKLIHYMFYTILELIFLKSESHFYDLILIIQTAFGIFYSKILLD